MNQNEIRALLTDALQLRPDMELQDAVKLLYQHTFGSGHIVSDPHAALQRLTEEMNCCKDDSLDVYEEIGHGLCRLNLAPAKALGCSPETVGKLFLRCATQSYPVPAEWPAMLYIVKEFPFPNTSSDFSLEQYFASGCPLLHHSETYRQLYHPAYRVVRTDEARFLPLLAKLDSFLREGHGQLFVAIDGMSASGKSTLGALLKDLYDCTLLHMDDFFLPPEKKTAERLATPGGNVDWERFRDELLSPMKNGRPGVLRRYDCHRGQYAPSDEVVPGRLVVTEGSYSLHPALAEAYDVKVFCSISPEMQMERIRKRNGPLMAKRFQTEWIPLENAYFSACHTAEQCDFSF